MSGKAGIVVTAGLTVLAAASATPASGAVATKVKQDRVVVKDAGAGSNAELALKGRLVANKQPCVRNRPVKLKSQVATLATDRTNGKGRFKLTFSLSDFPDGEELTASVKAKGAGKRGPACKAGSSTLDPEPVASSTTFDYDGDTMRFSGVVSSGEPDCLGPRPWKLRKDNVEQFEGLTEAGTGAWGPTEPADTPSGTWVIGVGILGLDADTERLPGGGLRWPYCSQTNGLRDIP